MHGTRGNDPGGTTDPTDHHRLVREAAMLAGSRGSHRALERLVDDMSARLVGAERAPMLDAIVTVSTEGLRSCWTHGWQPEELTRHVERTTGADVAALLADLMVDELTGYPPASVHPDFFDQLTAVRATRWWPVEQHWLAARADAAGSWSVTVEQMVILVAVLHLAPRLTVLLPVPGSALPARAADHPHHVDAKTLRTVRQLLAKAESTTFPAEAETFTAAAQKLMARHSIDQAMLAAAAAAEHPGGGALGGADGPLSRRLWIDTPYVREKVALVAQVADANHARTVWQKELDVVTVMGHEADLDAVELLFTSLLVQATRAMQQEGKRVTAWGDSRTRSFRKSFLAAYAMRIGERLQEASRAETEQASDELARQGRGALVPVLAARDAAVQAYAEQEFPRVRTVSMGSAHDAEGWHRGRQAADRAALGAPPRRPVARR